MRSCRARFAARVSGGHDRNGRWRARAGPRRSSRISGRAAAARSAARRAGHGVSVAGLAGAGGDSVRRDAHLRRDRRGDRPSARGPRRRARVRDQSRRARDSVSPRRAGGGWNGRIPLGRGAEEGPPQSGNAGRQDRQGGAGEATMGRRRRKRPSSPSAHPADQPSSSPRMSRGCRRATDFRPGLISSRSRACRRFRASAAR